MMRAAAKEKFFRICVIAVLICMCAALVSCGSGDTVLPGSRIRINEVMSSNSFFAALPDGSCYDWVELYNESDSSIDLQGYGLSDNSRKLLKWQVPQELIIQPHGYAVIYLSGLDCVDEYGNFHAGFRLSAKKGEKLYLSSVYGDLLQELSIPVCESENISYGIDERNEKGGYVWMSEPTPGSPCRGNTAANADELTFAEISVKINEYMTDNSYILYDRDGEYNDWVELYNPLDEAVSLAGCALSDNGAPGGDYWYFPDDTVIEAGGYLLVFCSGKTTLNPDELHASFRLGSEDTSLVFYSASGLPADSVDIMTLPENVSCGVDAESGELRLYSSPTPGRENSTYSHALTDSVYGVPVSGVIISETLSVSSAAGSSAYDYIELHNRSGESISIENYGLSDCANEVKFVFPAMTVPAGGYILVKCTGSESKSKNSLAASFKLGSGGETVYLTDADGHLIDKLSSGGQRDGVSRGRKSSELYHLYYFTAPTPGSKNSESSAYLTYAPQPVFSIESGYVKKGTTVYITGCDGCTVRYTTDGSTPTSSSAKYKNEKGIVINSTCVLSAAAFKDGCLKSRVTVSSYFADVSHSLPVMSLTTDPVDMFSDETGIYSNSFMMYGTQPNYTSEDERAAVLEYFIDGKSAVKFCAGVRIFGESSRSIAQKSLAVMMRESYGVGSVNFPFFGSKGQQSFSSLVLRQSGQESKESKLRDELCTSIIKDRIECDCMDYTPIVLYINGRYWGIYYIREKLNEDYLIAKYGFTKGNTDLIKSQCIVQAGSMDSYDKLTSYVENHDMTNEKYYSAFCEMADIKSLMDYWICETFLANNDTSNIRCYLNHEEGGKWRWMIFDLDNACYPYMLRKNTIYDHLLDEEGHGIVNECSNVIMRSLLKNSDFKKSFVERYCHHLKTTFAPERTTALLDELASRIESEIPAQYERWGWPAESAWHGNLDNIRDFLNKREEYVVRYLKSSFGYSDKEFDKIYKAA